MRPFAYSRPGDAAAARAQLAEHPGARYLGGGTNLVDLMRLGVETPGALVDVSRVGSTEVREAGDGGIVIGAAVRNSELAADPIVRERYPVLSSALLQGASGQLRNLATTAGNLLQRTRCPYFQDIDLPCNKRDGGNGPEGCPAREGEHHNLAILGGSESCIATHPSDMAVALVALGATVQLLGSGGERSQAVEALYRLPGDEPDRETVMEPGELILSVTLPPLRDALTRHSSYTKIRERASYAFALVALAAALEVQDGVVREARLALGGVAPKPWRAHRAEAVLQGAPAQEATFLRAAEAELAAAEPLPGNAYKVALARNVIVDSLLELTAER